MTRLLQGGRGFIMLLGVMGLCLALGPGRAAAAVRFDMFVGYDGVVPQGSWFPIVFEVQNDGPAFTARVEVAPGQFNPGHTRSMRVELPTGTTKRFTLPAFAAASYSPTWTARLLDERGRVRVETSSQQLRRYNSAALPMAAALSRQIPPLPQPKNPQEDLRPVFARLQPGLFPDNPLTLEGLDVLYLSSERALELRAGQVSALMAWLHAGGRLMVGLEQLNHLTGPGEWLRLVLPFEAKEMRMAQTHAALQQWLGLPDTLGVRGSRPPVVRKGRTTQEASEAFGRAPADAKFEESPLQCAGGTVRAGDGKVMIGTEETPLVVRAARGRGEILLLTFAPELEPFRSWKNAELFWAKSIGFPPELLEPDAALRSRGRSVDGIVGAMIDSEQVRKLPVGWLLLLLVAYLVVFGPMDRILLQRLNRQMLTWVTFPVYVVLFSLLIYYIGYRLRAGETEWTELHILDVTPHGERADFRGRSYGSLYSPVNARYEFESTELFASLRGEFTGQYGGGQDVGRGSVEQLSTGFKSSEPVPVWTSQLMLHEWWRQAPTPVEVRLTGSTVTVKNRLPVGLQLMRLAIGGQLLELGNLAAGAEGTYSRSAVPLTPLANFVEQNGSGFLQAVESRQRAFGDSAAGRLRDWPAAAMAVSFISLVSSPNEYNRFEPARGFDLAPLLRRGDSVLMAWVPEYSPTRPLNQFPARRERRNTLLRVLVEAPR